MEKWFYFCVVFFVVLQSHTILLKLFRKLIWRRRRITSVYLNVISIKLIKYLRSQILLFLSVFDECKLIYKENLTQFLNSCYNTFANFILNFEIKFFCIVTHKKASHSCKVLSSIYDNLHSICYEIY